MIAARWVVLVVFGLGCADHQKRACQPVHVGDTADIVVTVNNNPSLKASVTSSAKGQVFDFNNEPYIEVSGAGFVDGPNTVVVEAPGLELRRDVTVHLGRFKARIALERPLSDLSRGVDVSVGDVHRHTAAQVVKLHGTVRFFDGRAVPFPILPAPSPLDIAVRGNERGEYVMLLPHRRIESMAVWDRGYSVSNLETWLADVKLDRDFQLDVRVGELELHSLRVWVGKLNTTYVFFVPMSLGRYRALAAEGVSGELALGTNPNAWPHLDRSDVVVYFDQVQVDVSSFREVEDVVTLRGVTIRRPAYLLVIPGHDPRGKVIRVEAQHRFHERNERGEAFYLGFLSAAQDP